MRKAICINASDNVATCIEDIAEGDVVTCFGGGRALEMVARDAIDSGHKIALEPIGAGGSITKYGQVIGTAMAEIQPGEWVHLHNCAEIYVAAQEGSPN